MDEDLENQLKQEYVEIYSEDFTFECLDGWYPLIDATSHILATHRETREDLQIRQIKEKYGELRIHPNLSYGERSHVVTGAIELAKFMSMNTCEVCGSITDVEKRDDGVIRSLCPGCAQD